jgi:signal-transduction protein with cAMP-binding, CBS, and nucleotidyltransferase domain
VITDRDICMALATTGRRPEERMAGEVAGPHLHCVRPDDPVGLALETMRKHQVRRLPVVAGDGTLAGMVSINDLILRADTVHGRGAAGVTAQEVLFTLKSICRHRGHEAEPAHAEPLEAVAR